MSERLIDGPQGLLNLSEMLDGKGAPILFVHSDCGTLRHWDEIRAAMKDRPTAAFDRRGHGKSAPPESGSFDHADAASDIAAIADALGYDRYFLVAHSGGAQDAFAYASQEPDRLLGLVLVDPPPDPSVLPPGLIEGQLEKIRADAHKAVEEYYRTIAGEDPKIVDRLIHDARNTPKKTIIGLFEALARFRPANFTNYEGPALSIIQSQYDVDGALHRIAHMEHVAIDGAGHWIHLAAPDRFLDALEEFISDHEHAPDRHGAIPSSERRTAN